MPGFAVLYTPQAAAQLERLYWYLASDRDEPPKALDQSAAAALRIASDEIDAYLKHGPDSIGDRVEVAQASLPSGCNEVRQLTRSVLSVRYLVFLQRREVHVFDILWLPGLTLD